MSIATRASQFLAEPHGQVSAVVPAGEHIGETAAQQARPVDRVFDAKRGNDAKVGKEVVRMVARKSVHIAATEIDTANQLATMHEWDHRDAINIHCPGQMS